MLKHTFKKAGYLFAPRLTDETLAYRHLFEELRDLRGWCAQADSLESVVGHACSHRTFGACQKESEILRLLQLLKSHPPRRICEIGGELGGTLFLFSQVAAPDAAILSIDVAYTRRRRWAHRHLGRKGQKVSCLRSDSHSSGAVDFLRRWLANDKIDFLFIDGDHSFHGVSKDYEMYSPYVRPGGIIAVHDIVPDYKTRHGVATSSDVGDVPRFWAELKRVCRYPTSEFIDDPAQDGYGIGVVRFGGP